MVKILEGSIVAGKSGKPLEVVAIDGEKVVVKSGDELLRVARSAILHILSPPPPTSQNFHIGDRVTLLDKFMVRAADFGTIEAITDKGIQILWDKKTPDEPNLKQPPVLWRTFKVEELELIDRGHQQN